MQSPLVAPLGALLLLAACSSETTTETQPTETSEASKLPATGAGTPIELGAIGEGEAPVIKGELGCDFTIEGQSGPAFIAKANVGSDATAFGAVKIGTQVQRVAGPGGFKKLEKGMELSGTGIRISVERMATSSTVKDGERSSYPARLTANRTYGGERSYDGTWTCGP